MPSDGSGQPETWGQEGKEAQAFGCTPAGLSPHLRGGTVTAQATDAHEPLGQGTSRARPRRPSADRQGPRSQGGRWTRPQEQVPWATQVYADQFVPADASPRTALLSPLPSWAFTPKSGQSLRKPAFQSAETVALKGPPGRCRRCGGLPACCQSPILGALLTSHPGRPSDASSSVGARGPGAVALASPPPAPLPAAPPDALRAGERAGCRPPGR